jgi:hypothetical protein
MAVRGLMGLEKKPRGVPKDDGQGAEDNDGEGSGKSLFQLWPK